MFRGRVAQVSCAGACSQCPRWMSTPLSADGGVKAGSRPGLETQSPSAAPDVDLKAEGFPARNAVLAVMAMCGAMVLFQWNSGVAISEAEQDLESGSGATLWWLFHQGLQLLKIVLFLVLALFLFLVTRQRSILYMPTPPGAQRSPKDNPEGFRDPSEWRMSFENVTIRSADGTNINAWYVYHTPRRQAPYTLVYFHGNAGNMGHRLENIRDMHERLAVNVLIVDYRAFGDSQDGSGPCQEGFLMDAMATYRWLVERVGTPSTGDEGTPNPHRILLFGRSIGGAVAICLMAELLRLKLRAPDSPEALPLPAGLMLENTFASLREMAITLFPFLKFIRPLLRSPLLFDEWQAAKELKFIATNHKDWCCLLLSGLQDQIVPPSQMRHLYSILMQHQPHVLSFKEFPRGGHNDTPTRGGSAYWLGCGNFLERVRSTEESRLSATVADVER